MADGAPQMWPDAEQIIGRLGLVLAEALNNIAEHAYAARPGGLVVVRLRVDGEGVLVEIVDRGAPMPENRLPVGRLPPADVDLDELPEGGFGWYLIHDQADDVRYGRVDGENRLLLFFAIRGSA